MIISSKIILREKTPDDAWEDYAWDTDPELAQLDAAPALSIPYSQYLMEYNEALRNPPKTSQRFAVETLDGKHIGNCSYYNLNKFKGEVELGIMIGNRDYWDKGYGADTVVTLVNYIYSQTKVNRIYLKTLDWNTRAQKCFQKCGFKSYGQLARDGYNFQLMEIYRNQWQKQKDKTSE